MQETTVQARAPVARWRWGLHLALIAGYVALIGAYGLVREEGAEPAFSKSARGLLVTSFAGLTVFGVVFGTALLASRATVDDLLLRWRGGVLPLPLGLGYSVSLRLLLVIPLFVVAFALILFGVLEPQQLDRVAHSSAPDIGALVSLDAVRDDAAYYWLLVTFASFVVAGLREELWRAGVLAGLAGLWPRHFTSRGGQLIGAALAALLFGFGHSSMGLVATVATGLLGLGFGAIMIVHRSIWPAVIAHGCFDATSFVLLRLAERHT